MNRSMDLTATDFAESAIARYFERCPASADTVDGVHNWWIAWPGLPDHISVTERALARMQSRGMVECVRLGNREVWRLRRPLQAPEQAAPAD